MLFVDQKPIFDFFVNLRISLAEVYCFAVNLNLLEALAKLLQDDSPSLYGRTLWGLKGLGGG